MACVGEDTMAAAQLLSANVAVNQQTTMQRSSLKSIESLFTRVLNRVLFQPERQGMHEVLAPLILALEKEAAAAARADTSTGYSAASAAEKVEKGDGATATARTTPWVGKSTVNGAPMDATTHSGAAATLGRGSTPQDLEADAFWLFSAVMKGLEGFYEHGTNNASSTRTREPAGERSGAGEGVDSPVVEMCKRLQGVRMREADPELQRHLAELDISPQVGGGLRGVASLQT